MDREVQDALAKQYMSEQYDAHQNLKASLVAVETEKYYSICTSEPREGSDIGREQLR